VHGLYEDQAGLFDWRLQYVGKAEFIEYLPGGHSGSRIIVGTEQNVIAAINGRNGHVGWRHIMEKGSIGHIDDMKVSGNYVLVVLSGGSYIRCFNSISGNLLWESTMPSTQTKPHVQAAVLASDRVAVLANSHVAAFDLETGSELWSVKLSDSSAEYIELVQADDSLYVIGRAYNSHVTVTVLSCSTGSLQQPEYKAPAAWITQQHKCTTVAGGHFVCIDTTTAVLRILPLKADTSNGTVSFVTVTLPSEVVVQYNAVQFTTLQSTADLSTSLVALRVNNRDSLVATFDSNVNILLMKYLPGVLSLQVVSYSDEPAIVTLSTSTDSAVVSMKGFSLADGVAITDLSRVIPLPAHHGSPQQMLIGVGRGKDCSAGFNVLVLSDDHSLVLLEQPKGSSPGRVLWSREEALSSVLSVEFVDLPVSQIMAKMEDEFGAHGDSIWNLFLKRFRTQFSQLAAFMLQLKQKLRAPRHPYADRTAESYETGSELDDIEDMSDKFDEEYLTRDEFNLHKMIVVVTAPGKIYGLDSLSGGIVWCNLLPNVTPYVRGDTVSMPLFVQRTTAHFPHQPLCTVLCRDKLSGRGVLYSFHPINGHAVDGAPAVGEVLAYNVINAVMLAQMDDQFLKPLLLLDTDKQYHVYPFSDTELVRSLSSTLFTFVTDVETGIITGYQLSALTMSAEPLWTLDTGRQQQTITKVVSKRAIEHVHSQGIVLEDRSVLYKYLNPNLVAVVAEGEDNQQKSLLTVFLVDAVTGNVVFHCTHKRSRGPVHIVHSENWIVYNLWNMKNRRVELAVLELYEGSRQSNSTAFSSFHPPSPPIVMRQAYIFPGHISAIATTVTEKGISSKDLLFALETGSILGLPKAIIDPRRPEVMSQEAREEGLIPYMPELPRPFDRMINYNQTVFNVRGIHTAPAGLESTSLVLCYGLDLFFTRVMPSKMFDVLKEDFDYFFISSVLVGMIAVSIISQKLAARKALSRAWK